MPLLVLLAEIVCCVLLGYLAIWVIDQLAPNHPKIADNIIWVVVVLVIVVMVLNAFGIVGPRVPRFGG